MSVMDWSAYWRNEAKIAASDGHPHAALFAMAKALLPADLVATPGAARATHPHEVAELEQYASALGLNWTAGNG